MRQVFFHIASEALVSKEVSYHDRDLQGQKETDTEACLPVEHYSELLPKSCQNLEVPESLASLGNYIQQTAPKPPPLPSSDKNASSWLT